MSATRPIVLKGPIKTIKIGYKQYIDLTDFLIEQNIIPADDEYKSEHPESVKEIV